MNCTFHIKKTTTPNNLSSPPRESRFNRQTGTLRLLAPGRPVHPRHWGALPGPETIAPRINSTHHGHHAAPRRLAPSSKDDTTWTFRAAVLPRPPQGNRPTAKLFNLWPAPGRISEGNRRLATARCLGERRLPRGYHHVSSAWAVRWPDGSRAKGGCPRCYVAFIAKHPNVAASAFKC